MFSGPGEVVLKMFAARAVKMRCSPLQVDRIWHIGEVLL